MPRRLASALALLLAVLVAGEATDLVCADGDCRGLVEATASGPETPPGDVAHGCLCHAVYAPLVTASAVAEPSGARERAAVPRRLVPSGGVRALPDPVPLG